MAWFFSDTEINSNSYIIEGKDAEHISKSLRMKKGEEITLENVIDQVLPLVPEPCGDPLH